MEKLLQELLERVKNIEYNQQKILDTLHYAKFNPKYKDLEPNPDSNEAYDEQEEMLNIIMHGAKIRDKFNLVIMPQVPRLKAYLRTGDPSVFDGLKRKS